MYSEVMGRNAEDITQELKQRFTQIWRLNGAYDPETLAALTYYVAVLLEYRNELKPSALPVAATSIADLVAELRHDYGEYHRLPVLPEQKTPKFFRPWANMRRLVPYSVKAQMDSNKHTEKRMCRFWICGIRLPIVLPSLADFRGAPGIYGCA